MLLMIRPKSEIITTFNVPNLIETLIKVEFQLGFIYNCFFIELKEEGNCGILSTYV